MNLIQKILVNSKYNLSIFNNNEIKKIEKQIFLKKINNIDKPFLKCIIRNKEIVLKPEEVVRQLYALRLIETYGYPKERIRFEFSVNFGIQVKQADIVVLDKNRVDTPFIIIELKKPKLSSGKEQLKSYCNATGAPIGVWTNGEHISNYNRKDPNYFEEISDIPKSSQSLSEVLSDRYTIKNLLLKDKVSNERKSLKEIILEMEDEVLANAGVDVFEEVFKLIFTKLFDEYESKDDKIIIDHNIDQNLSDKEKNTFENIKNLVSKIDDKNFRLLEFRNSGQTETELKNKIQNLFNRAKEKWSGIFDEGSIFNLSDSHLSICVSSLQDIKLFNSNLLVIDEAFEYLVNKDSKNEKGQFFTPRHVIDMCVKMLNPKAGEYMIDTASGSCGFPVHTIFKITGSLFKNKIIPKEQKANILKIFGIDFDEKVVRVARTLNLIAGDGETNVLYLNTLDYERWGDRTEKDSKWINTYGKGFERLKKLRVDNNNKKFNFDVLMANPPFAGDIKESRILHKYQLAFKDNGKPKDAVGRDVLFLERNLDFLKSGGRMAIVLPQGRFNNQQDRYIRDFITKHGRIIAVIGLDWTTFKPHTPTKTSILIFQKWDDKICPQKDDYSIFFAVSEKSGKTRTGEYIFVKEDDLNFKLDHNGHLIYEHDLHNQDGVLPDGIAEKFVEWGKKEKLSFLN
jgi:type I restriction enzyme M protein